MTARIEAALSKLRSAGNSLRCSELIKTLEDLGFEVRDGRKAGHKIVTHPGLEGFYSASFSCGHGKDPQVKRPYIQQIRKVIETHKDELEQFIQEGLS